MINTAGMLLLRIKITELLMDVYDWTGFSRHFVHLKDGEPAKDRTLLQAWHILDETYSAGLAELVNTQLNHAFAGNWGDGSTSSSDGHRCRA